MRQMRLAVILMALGLAAPCAGASPPTLRTIAADGVFEDWVTVLVNPANASQDGTGRMSSCGWSTDRDCFVSDGASDLRLYAFTWDASNLYVYLRRDIPHANRRTVLVFLDANRSRSLDPGERILGLTWEGSKRDVTADVWQHIGTSAIPLVDAMGNADGLDPAMLNTYFQSVGSVFCDTCGDSAALQAEAAIPWAMLGAAPGTPYLFHVSSTDSNSNAAPYQDNMGGAGGKIGEMGFVHLEATPGGTRYAAPGATAFFPHRIAARSNLPVLPNLSALASVRVPLAYYSDPNGDGDPWDGVLIAQDGDGDGLFDKPAQGDVAPPPEWDADSNGIPDPGAPFPAGDGLTETGAFSYVIGVTSPPGGQHTDLTIAVRAVAGAGPSEAIEVTDRAVAGRLLVTENPDVKIVSGGSPAFPHRVLNRSGSALTADLTILPSAPHVLTLYTDPDFDGTPDLLWARDGNGDGSWDMLGPGADSNGNGLPDTGNLPDGGDFGVLVVAAGPGSSGAFTLTAGTETTPRLTDSAEDRWTIVEEFTLTPASRTLAGGGGLAIAAGSTAYYPHRLCQAGATTRSYVLDASSASGWQVRIFTDPDGDGSPADGEPLALPALVGPLNGATPCLDVVVATSAPLSAGAGVTDIVTTSASPWDAPGDIRTSIDETAVGRAVLTRDAAHSLPARFFPPCGTVHLLLAGLLPAEPAGRYRTRWMDPSWTLRKATALSTDASGASSDLYAIAPGDAAGEWILILEETLDGINWSALDAQPFTLERDGRILSARPDKLVYRPAGESLVVNTVLGNANREAALAGTILSAVILAPGTACGAPGGAYLTGGGFFAPYTGVETSFASPPLSTPAGGSTAQPITFPSVLFPLGGTYAVQLVWDTSCGGPPLASTCAGPPAATFEVEAAPQDSDGDGLGDTEETDEVGSDPLDADTDDDGLGDGEEHLVLETDPVDADTDDDGLTDGIEVGVVLPGAGTDPASPFFVPDLDPLTVTDPLDPDTDRGGLPDGLEDVNRNGASDTGERDPLRGMDDACNLLPPPETTNLRVRRQGEDLILSWDGSPDPCVTFEIWIAATVRPDRAGLLVLLDDGMTGDSAIFYGAASPGDHSPYAFLILPVSDLSGPGPSGHFGL